MLDEGILASAAFYALGAHDTVVLERYSEQTFLRRLAHEDDLGGAVIFLLSDASRYIMGVQLPVDGGYTAH